MTRRLSLCWVMILGVVFFAVGIAIAQDSLNVTRIGQLSMPQDEVHNVVVSGSHAYVCQSTAGLRVVNVNNPAAPYEVGYCSIPYAGHLAVSGLLVYVGDWFTGMRIIDVSNPSNPYEVGFYDPPTYAECHAVAVYKSYAYVTYYNPGGSTLLVIDVSNPAMPREVGHLDLAGYDRAEGIALVWPHVFIADGGAGMRIVNISRPWMPVEVGYYNTPGGCDAVAIYESYAYVGDGAAGLQILNISHISAPYLVANHTFPGSALDPAISWPYCYVAGGSSGLRILNVSNPAEPVEVGYYNTLSPNSNSVFVYGLYAYLADFNCLGVYQLTLPTVTITMTPNNPPIQIPINGGSFGFIAVIANGGQFTAFLQAWSMVQLPSGDWFGPLLGPFSLTLPSMASLTRNIIQNVPASAPAGEFWYEGRLGYYPSAVLDTSGFSFTKLTTGDGPWVSDWSCTGEEIAPQEGAQPCAPTPLSCTPNPFNPSTVLSYQLPIASRVSLRVYDTAGRLVMDLVNGWRNAGEHQITFDGSGLPSGIYFANLEAADFSQVQKMILMK